MARLALLCFAVFALLAGSVSQGVANPQLEWKEKTLEEQWREKLLAAHLKVIEAQKRHDAALTAYKQMRNRNRKRGDAKRVVIEELELAKAALPRAEQELETLTEEARRAGVPPGTMRFDEAELAAAASD